MGDHTVAEEIIGVPGLFGESAALPFAEAETSGGGLVLRDMGVQRFLLFNEFTRSPGISHHRLPISLGEDGHESQAELPAGQAGFLLEE